MSASLSLFVPFSGCKTDLRAVIATAGLAVATAPDYAHYLPLFRSMATHNNLPTGLATVLAPSVAATLFMLFALVTLHRKYSTVLRSRKLG